MPASRPKGCVAPNQSTLRLPIEAPASGNAVTPSTESVDVLATEPMVDEGTIGASCNGCAPSEATSGVPKNGATLLAMNPAILDAARRLTPRRSGDWRCDAAKGGREGVTNIWRLADCILL